MGSSTRHPILTIIENLKNRVGWHPWNSGWAIDQKDEDGKNMVIALKRGTDRGVHFIDLEVRGGRDIPTLRQYRGQFYYDNLDRLIKLVESKHKAQSYDPEPLARLLCIDLSEGSSSG